MNYRMSMTIGALLIVINMSVGAAESIKLFTKQCEEALALSALPERLRENATVYVLGKHGFEKSRTGNGPFACLANRNHPDSIIPMCYDEPGIKAVLPSELRRGEMILAGKTNADYVADRSRRVETGEVRAPSAARPGQVQPVSITRSPKAETVLHDVREYRLGCRRRAWHEGAQPRKGVTPS